MQPSAQEEGRFSWAPDKTRSATVPTAELWILTYPFRELSQRCPVAFTAAGGPPYTAISETQRRNPLCINALTPFNVVYPLSMLQEHLLVPSILTASACSRPLAVQLTATATQAAATALSCLFLSPPRRCLGYLREGLSLTAFLSNFGHGSALAQGLQSVLPPF